MTRSEEVREWIAGDLVARAQKYLVEADSAQQVIDDVLALAKAEVLLSMAVTVMTDWTRELIERGDGSV